MTTSIEFSKLSASGNDFICIDNRDGRFEALLNDSRQSAAAARSLCRRGPGIGADGLILACQCEVPDHADIAARFFECDGSEVELCGNGVACFTYWVIANGFIPPGEVKILTSAGVIRGQNGSGDYVRVCIPVPEQIRTDVEVPIDGRTYRCDFAITGVPHIMTYVQDVETTDVAQLGPALRHHEQFQPRGVNANFVQVLGEGELALRTWEFGVEGETLACGTGSAAVAILAARRFGWGRRFTGGDEPVRVHTRGGEELRIYFSVNDNGDCDDLCLESVVSLIYRATIGPGLLAEAFGPHA